MPGKCRNRSGQRSARRPKFNEPIKLLMLVLRRGGCGKRESVFQAQPGANKHALDTRRVMMSTTYRSLFPRTRLATDRTAVDDFSTTERGFRMATSVGGVLTGRGADFIIVDDPIKPDEAISDSARELVNTWYHRTLLSRLNHKGSGCIILIMQRVHEDDLAGHLMATGNWKVLSLPAIAEIEEQHTIHRLGRTTLHTRHPWSSPKSGDHMKGWGHP
jgi:hypothetical protein